MRILVVTPFLWSGAGRAIVRIACDLRDMGHDMALVSSGESRGLCDWPSYVQELQAHRIPYHQIDFFDRDSKVFPQSVERLKQVVREFRPDVIHANSGMAAFGACAAANVPVVATLHSWGTNRPEWMNAMDVWALNQCARVVSLSFSYRDYLLSLGLRPDITQVIYFGVDCENIRKLAAGFADTTLSDQKYFCFLGRLESRKRQTLLVEALRLLPEDWHLLLMGTEGESGYAEKVQRQAADLGISKRMVWTGQLENPFPLIRKSRCFVSASSDEGLGLSALEAMVIGVPVVATPARGIVDFIRDGETGLFAEPTPGAIAEKILTLDSEPSIRNGLVSRAADMIRSSFSWERTVQQYLAVFEDVAQRETEYSIGAVVGAVCDRAQS